MNSQLLHFCHILCFLDILDPFFFNFPFPMGYRLEKGHNMPVLCSILLKLLDSFVFLV